MTMTDELPEPFRDEWRSIGTRTERGNVALLSIVAETTVYERHDAPDARTRDDSEMPLRSLFTVDLRIHPPLSTLGTSPTGAFSMAAGRAKDRFVSSIEDDGFAVENERKTLEFDRGDGVAGKWYVLETTAFADGTNGGGSETIDAETHVAVWPTATAYAMAGGTLPLETAVELEDAFDVEPQRDRETVAAFVRAIASQAANPGATEAQTTAESGEPVDESSGPPDEPNP